MTAIPNEMRPWLLVAAGSLVMVPLAVFFGGLLLAGPYEGESGFFSMAGEIYRDAVTGHLSAIALLLSPVLLLAIWKLAAIAYKFICERQAAEAANQES